MYGWKDQYGTNKTGRTESDSYGMKYSWKGYKDRNRHKNRMKRSGQSRLVYVKNINHNIPTTWRWAGGDCRKHHRFLTPVVVYPSLKLLKWQNSVLISVCACLLLFCLSCLHVFFFVVFIPSFFLFFLFFNSILLPFLLPLFLLLLWLLLLRLFFGMRVVGNNDLERFRSVLPNCDLYYYQLCGLEATHPIHFASPLWRSQRIPDIIQQQLWRPQQPKEKQERSTEKKEKLKPGRTS